MARDRYFRYEVVSRLEGGICTDCLEKCGVWGAEYVGCISCASVCTSVLGTKLLLPLLLLLLLLLLLFQSVVHLCNRSETSIFQATGRYIMNLSTT